MFFYFCSKKKKDKEFYLKLKNENTEISLSDPKKRHNDFYGYILFFHKYKWHKIQAISFELNKKICRTFGFYFLKIKNFESLRINYTESLKSLYCVNDNFYDCLPVHTLFPE